jgi:hypothetical protein
MVLLVTDRRRTRSLIRRRSKTMVLLFRTKSGQRSNHRRPPLSYPSRLLPIIGTRRILLHLRRTFLMHGIPDFLCFPWGTEQPVLASKAASP